MANGRCCGGIFTFVVCGEGLERYFSKEVEGDFVVWFRGECACSPCELMTCVISEGLESVKLTGRQLLTSS